MIKAGIGKNGSGKGFLAARWIEWELLNTRRVIITNLCVKGEAWSNAFTKESYGGWRLHLQQFKLTQEEIDACLSRLVYVEDMAKLREFYLYRDASFVPLACVRSAKLDEEGHAKVLSFDVPAGTSGVVYLIDEAWKVFPARDWKNTADGILHYLNQHRHFGDDVWFFTPHSKQIESQIRPMVQTWSLCRNHGLEVLSKFRRPTLFDVDTYFDCPTGANAVPQSSERFRVNKTLMGTYDTSGGIGHSGGMAADVGAKRQGIHWAWGVGALAAGLLLLAFGVPALLRVGVHVAAKPGFGMSETSKFIASVSSNSPAVQGVTSNESAMGRLAASRELDHLQPSLEPKRVAETIEAPVAVRNTSLREVDDVWLTGFSDIGGQVRVLLSDGSSYGGGDRELELVTSKLVVINGKVYRWPKRLKAVSDGGSAVLTRPAQSNPATGLMSDTKLKARLSGGE